MNNELRKGPSPGGSCFGCTYHVVSREGDQKRSICTLLSQDVGFYPANTWKCPYKITEKRSSHAENKEAYETQSAEET